jgi:catechol 2,3-dioxygenase-like lactoylglutathione lyase family enzyme
MASDLSAVCFAATEPRRLVEFWSRLLGWEPVGGATLVAPDDTGFRIRFLPTSEPKLDLNRAHLDLTSASLQHQQRTVARALELGGRHVDVGQRPEEPHVVIADPEGNEFCVIEPGNDFLADCGLVGALACDGSQEVGYFWSAALGWPLVWDQDQETAIRSPLGGPKITWGGPPLTVRTGRDRVRLDLTAAADGDPQAEVDRLLTLGATRMDHDLRHVGWVNLADPDGGAFCVLTSHERGHRTS